jgi:hypothetical protein
MLITRSLLILAALCMPAVPVSAQSVRIIEWSRGNSEVALLFIHGLGGCAVPYGESAGIWCPPKVADSFRNEASGRTWPEIVEADDRPLVAAALAGNPSKALTPADLGLIGIDYSRLTSSGCANFGIFQIAQAVRGALQASGVLERYEQFIIVAHSMGGIITKQMLVDWKVGGDPSAMTRRILGVMMLGVPSQGSPIASGAFKYLNDAFGIDTYVRLCHRQVEDLFSGDENSYLNSLEGSWTDLLHGLRSNSHSQLPMVGCAYENTSEVQLLGYGVEIVPRLYATTQCSLASFPVARKHTDLPKPIGKDDDVNGPWLMEDLKAILAEWARTPFSTFEFSSDEPTLLFLRDHLNSNPQILHLDIDDDVLNFRPKLGPYQAGNRYGLVLEVAKKNSELCMKATFAFKQKASILLRRRGLCT